MPYPGEVLLGKSFGAFDGHEEAPVFIQHLDNMFLVWALCGIAPLLYQVLALLPFKRLQRFLASGDYFYQVSISTRHSHPWQSSIYSLISPVRRRRSKRIHQAPRPRHNPTLPIDQTDRRRPSHEHGAPFRRRNQ